MKKDILTLCTGMLLGAALTGGALAAGIMAEPTWQKIYVDGQQVEMTAYNIAGNNYVKLRDIGAQVGFNVYWDNGVQIDTDAPYTGTAPVSAATAAANSNQTTGVETARTEILSLTNALRRENGLAVLGTDTMLTKAAQVRADEMAAVGVYSHTRPDGSKYNTVTDVPYTAENIHRISDWTLTSTGQSLAEYAVDAWANSEGHRKNMLNDQVSELGIGLARGINASGEECWYCVQIFLYDGYAITWVDSPATVK